MTTPSSTNHDQVNGSISNTTTEDYSQETLREVCRQVHDRVHRFLAVKSGNGRISRVQEQTRITLRIIEEALERYTLDELSFSYNGGKDCLVLLILFLAGLHSFATRFDRAPSNDRHHEPFRIPQTLPAVYIISKHPFQEVDDFVDASSKAYHLSLSRYADSMKDAFTAYLRDFTRVKAIFVGTRRTDPHGALLKHFDPTDRGWPAFMRIHPVIDWHYAEVWAFIRTLSIPYCSLYDRGYTSLGGTADTVPNPKLRRNPADKSGSSAFKPAYELEDDDEERLGRPV